MIRRYLPKSTEELIHWYERYVAPGALVVGFLLDNFIFLDRIDSLESYVLLSSYMLLAAAGIALIHLIETGRARPSRHSSLSSYSFPSALFLAAFLRCTLAAHRSP
jgi:hypothetical protein